MANHELIMLSSKNSLSFYFRRLKHARRKNFSFNSTLEDWNMYNERSTRAIELFSGIGGFRIACDELGIKTVFANDIRKNSCDVYRHNFGTEILHEGDINALVDVVPEHDLLTGGFPCQPFSAAGKKKGTSDPRGTLFMAIADILEKRKPKHFVLENVARLLSMDDGRHFATIIDTLCNCGYGVEWRVLDAKNFGLPQTRKRVFICGTKGNRTPRLATPPEFPNESLPESCGRIDEHGKRFPYWGLAHDGEFVGGNPVSFLEAGVDKKVFDILADADDSYDLTASTLARMEDSIPVNRFVDGVEILSNQKGGARMGYTIFGTNGVSPTLTSSSSRHYERFLIDGKYRRLTPTEYARIQGFPDEHCDTAKHGDRYVMFGNAVPPPMARWAIEKSLGTD